MNAVTDLRSRPRLRPSAASGTPPPAPASHLSPPLRRFVADALERRLPPPPGEDVGFLMPPPTPLADPAARQEAAEAARAMEPCLAPPSLELVTWWLARLNRSMVGRGGGGQPLGQAAFLAVAEDTHFALAEMPAGVFTEATQREAMLAGAFFPTPADVAALLRPHAARLRNMHAALLRAALPPPPPPPPQPPPPGPEERAAVAARVREVREVCAAGFLPLEAALRGLVRRVPRP